MVAAEAGGLSHSGGAGLELWADKRQELGPGEWRVIRHLLHAVVFRSAQSPLFENFLLESGGIDRREAYELPATAFVRSAAHRLRFEDVRLRGWLNLAATEIADAYLPIVTAERTRMRRRDTHDLGPWDRDIVLLQRIAGRGVDTTVVDQINLAGVARAGAVFGQRPPSLPSVHIL